MLFCNLKPRPIEHLRSALNTDLQKCFEFMSFNPFPRKPVQMVSFCNRRVVNTKTTIFVLNKGPGNIPGSTNWILQSDKPSYFQWEVGSVEYLLDVQHVVNAPSVLGEGPQWQGIFSNKCSCGVGQPFLPGSHRDSFPQTVKKYLQNPFEIDH